MNILFLTSRFLPEADASGICVYNVACEYVKNGHNVFVISEADVTENVSEPIDGINVFTVEEAWFTKVLKIRNKANGIQRFLMKILHLLRNMLLLPFYPNVSPFRARKVYALAKRTVSENNIDLVVGAYRPYESVYSLINLKKKFGAKIKCVSWYLDLLWANKKENRLLNKLHLLSCRRSFEKDLKLLDGILLPITDKENYIKNNDTCSKIRFFDFPLYVTDNGKMKKCSFEFPQDSVNVAFVGTLDSVNRNITKVIDILKIINQNGINIKLHIWGKLADPETVGLINNNHDIAAYHGYIDYLEVVDLLKKADFLLNVSNYLTYDMIPSKIFQLFSTGKPVLNFVSNKKDRAVPYFEKYGYAINIKTYAEFDVEQEETLVDFIKDAKNKKPAGESCFVENTPAFVASQIMG